jgi:hypothetical protein
MLGKRRTSHTKEAHESYLMSKSLISRVAGQEKEKKNGAEASLGWSGLKQHLGESKNKGWSLICKGRDQLQEQGLRQREVVGDKEQ